MVRTHLMHVLPTRAWDQRLNSSVIRWLERIDNRVQPVHTQRKLQRCTTIALVRHLDYRNLGHIPFELQGVYHDAIIQELFFNVENDPLHVIEASQRQSE